MSNIGSKILKMEKTVPLIKVNKARLNKVRIEKTIQCLRVSVFIIAVSFNLQNLYNQNFKSLIYYNIILQMKKEHISC